jgi:hypothetical protein
MELTVGDMVTGIAAFLGMGTIKHLYSRTGRLEERVNSIPEKYVPKDDYNQFTQEVRADLKEVLRLLNDKEDRKQ